jgi:DNA polymerase delta subunit 1
MRSVRTSHSHAFLYIGETKPFIRNVFTLNSCAHIVGTHTLEFYDEKELLQKWRDFVIEIDPDVVVGYNTSNFDFPYLLDRAKHLGVDKFPFLGRVRGNVSTRRCYVSWIIY